MMIKKLSLLLLIATLLLIGTVSAQSAGFYFTPTNLNEYQPIQGEKLEGYLTNDEGHSISVVSYVFNDGQATSHLIYARGWSYGDNRVLGAAIYPYLPTDGNWWKSTDGGGSWTSTGGINEVYNAMTFAKRSAGFYFGMPNTYNDLKQATLSITIRNAADNPLTIATLQSTFFINRFYPYLSVTGTSSNPHIGGTDNAFQTVTWSTGDESSTYEIEHLYLNPEGSPIMGVRYQRLWEGNYYYENKWSRSTYTLPDWSAYSGEYTTLEVLKGEFNTWEAGDFKIRTSIFDYKGRSHYQGYKEHDVTVTTSADTLRIYTKEEGTETPVLNNVYLTISSEGSIIYQGYLQGSYFETDFYSPRAYTVQASAPGYTPVTQQVTKTFTTDDNTLTYYFERLTSPTTSAFDIGNLRFIVTEAGTNNPMPNTKIILEGYEYFTDGAGSLSIPLPANGFGRVTPAITFGMANSNDRGIMGDWNGDGIDTFGVVRYSDLINWYVATFNEDGSPYNIIQFGSVGSTDMHPFTGDFNGDGKTTFGVYRSGKPEFILSTPTGGVQSRFDYDLSTYYGSDYDKITVLSGDWNGDGIETIGTFYNGVWRLWSANNAGRTINQFTFGMVGDKPLVGDWNGDGQDTVGVRRGNLFILSNVNAAATPTSTFRFYYGNNEAGLFPLAGDYNGDGKDKIGLWDNSRGKFYLSTGGYNYEVRVSGRPSITGLANVFSGQTTPIYITVPKGITVPTETPTGRPEGDNIGFLQVMGYLMQKEGIEEPEEQNVVLGILIIAFCAVLIGGLIGGSYGVLAGGIFGFILAIITGFIPLWIPLSFIAIVGIYVLMKSMGES